MSEATGPETRAQASTSGGNARTAPAPEDQRRNERSESEALEEVASSRASAARNRKEVEAEHETSGPIVDEHER